MIETSVRGSNLKWVWIYTLYEHKIKQSLTMAMVVSLTYHLRESFHKVTEDFSSWGFGSVLNLNDHLRSCHNYLLIILVDLTTIYLHQIKPMDDWVLSCLMNISLFAFFMFISFGTECKFKYNSIYYVQSSVAAARVESARAVLPTGGGARVPIAPAEWSVWALHLDFHWPELYCPRR